MEKPLYSQSDLTIKKFLIVIMSFLSLTVCLVLAALVFAIRADNNTKDKGQPQNINNTNFNSTYNNHNEYNYTYNGGYLPTKLLVDRSAILPPTDQMNIGSCWCFAMVYILEAQYHQQGVKFGFLKENEYVQFSKQAWFTWLHHQCVAHPEVKACNYGGIGIKGNSSEDQEIESLYYFVKAWPEAQKSLLPESVCPYLRKNESDPNWDYFQCPGLDTAIQSNPIEFKYINHTTVYSFSAIKRLLLESRRALGIGAPLPNMRYNIPCVGSPFENEEMCTKKQYRCPPRYNNDVEEYCYKWDVDARQRDGVFLSSEDAAYVAEMGGHAMNVVGYNDEWLYRNRFQTKANVAPMKGGFILHNSWRAEGHSVDYWMGEQSEENEAVLCPNHMSPFTWIPADLECVQANIDDVTKCSTDIQRVRGKGIAKGADLLNCSNQAICDPTKTYVLGRFGADANVQTLPDGSNRVEVIEIDSSAKTATSKIINKLPFWTFNKAFLPINFVENDKDGCGYWMMPYQTLENMLRLNWDLLDNFKVFDYHVEFTNSSYSANKDPSKDYTFVEKSTKKVQIPEFDGPLPYDYIY